MTIGGIRVLLEALRESEDYRVVKEAILNNKSQVRMCSFSEVHNHELMWAHYADQFRGICVAYNFSRLLRHLAENVTFVRMFAPLVEARYGQNACVPRVYLGSRVTDHHREMITARLAPLKIKTQCMTIRKYSISFEVNSPSWS